MEVVMSVGIRSVCTSCGATGSGETVDAVNASAPHQLIPNAGCPNAGRDVPRPWHEPIARAGTPYARPGEKRVDYTPDQATGEEVEFRRRNGYWPPRDTPRQKGRPQGPSSFHRGRAMPGPDPGESFDRYVARMDELGYEV